MQARAVAAIDGATTLDELDEVRVAFTGRKSELADVQKTMGSIAPEDRKVLGKALNAFKTEVEGALDQRRAVLEAAALEARLVDERIDLTVPPAAVPPGRPHLITQTEQAMVDTFVALGWRVADGPEVESAAYCFDAMNIPPDHPARQDMDTIYLQDGRTDEFGLPEVVLRPHTSPVQARVMRTQEPPIAIVIPGRTYRNDTVDATHSPVFTQVEGLVVGEGITMAHLHGSLLAFARAMFGEDREIRLRPSKFEFTEPSAEVDVSWGTNPDGTTRWLEILGSGMVDPVVLSWCGVDPDRFTGFAFGIGVERVAMLRHDLHDIRDLYEGDARFSAVF
nr:phenylalanine--tRNA ligase subunit alpha [Salsipaludibacter albus]